MKSSTWIRALVSLVFFGSMGFIAWHDRDAASRLATSAGMTTGFTVEEVGKRIGVDFLHRAPTLDPKLAGIMPHVAGMGAAVSVCDANGDRWPDVYTTNGEFGAPNALFVNQRDGTLRDVAAKAGLADLNSQGRGASMGSIWADIDNDGDEDVFVYRWGFPMLARNEGDLRFTEITREAGLERWMNSNAACWIDYDRDGLIDLYVCGYFDEQYDLWNLPHTRIMQESFEFASNGGHNYLFRNEGGGRFRDVTAEVGADSTRWTLGVASADFNDDGWPDLYVANDYGPEELFLNREGARFELAKGVGLDESSKSGMCVALGDFESKGRIGVYVTNISNKRFLFQGNNLRMNELAGSGRFINVAQDQVADCGWAWGAQFGDFDNDGFCDLFVVNGFISASKDEDYWYEMGKVAGAVGLVSIDAQKWPPMGEKSLAGYERSRVLWNRGGRGFKDVAQTVGVDDLYDGRSVAIADFDRRGALDVVVANQRGPLLVYRAKPLEDYHWVALDLIGTRSNRSAIGAEITVRYGKLARHERAEGESPYAHARRAVVDGGSGFCSQNQRTLHFGLGDADEVGEVEIRWPSGLVQILTDLAVDRLHTIEETAP